MGNLGSADAANENTAAGFAYDKDGNMTSDGTSGDKLKYDAWNRLVEVDNSGGQSWLSTGMTDRAER